MDADEYQALVASNLDLVDRVLKGRFRGVKIYRHVAAQIFFEGDVPGRRVHQRQYWAEVGFDEVRADCIAKLMLAGDTYRASANFRSWASAVIANHVRDLMRRRPMVGDKIDEDIERRRDEEQMFKTIAEMGGVIDEWDGDDDDALVDAVKREPETQVADRVAELIRPHLDGKSAELVEYLVELGELPPGDGTFRRVEERFGVKADTASKRWRRAIEALRKKMSESPT